MGLPQIPNIIKNYNVLAVKSHHIDASIVLGGAERGDKYLETSKLQLKAKRQQKSDWVLDLLRAYMP